MQCLPSLYWHCNSNQGSRNGVDTLSIRVPRRKENQGERRRCRWGWREPLALDPMLSGPHSDADEVRRTEEPAATTGWREERSIQVLEARARFSHRAGGPVPKACVLLLSGGRGSVSVFPCA
ncbi:hypothetical protein PVAP13_2NG648900 [Panicum virgatum]|uniref:Uncharacterized protein n=1 Tax=Panicum virgatum TaxID=38727 RepID=A0A8T0VZP6_PANVG|nr:hypothetical protein PVAP13_2NG648900 [Panicum virgatum]